jgi:predicted transcriptional regulator
MASDLLISVHKRFADDLLNGRKTVELRRRPIRAGKGSRIWIYCTVPLGVVSGVGIVASIVAGSTDWVWRHYGKAAAVSKTEFYEYFRDRDEAHAIVFSEVSRLKRPPTLAQLRTKARLHPPQFYSRLNESQVRFLEELSEG